MIFARTPASLRMTSKDQVEKLIQCIASLPEDAQAELLRSLVEMRAPNFGFDDADDDRS